MNREDKDIYELLNEVPFDINEEKEIKLNDIDKKKIKNIVLSKVKYKTNWKKNSIVAALIVIIAIGVLITPVGRKVVAQIKEMFFFNPGLGVIDTNEDLYVLDSPISTQIIGREVVIKSITSNERYISFDVWYSDKSLENLSKEEIIKRNNDSKSIVELININGEAMECTSYSIAGGGASSFVSGSFPISEITDNVTLRIFGVTLEPIKLTKVQDLKELQNVGGNSVSNGILVGGNRYSFNGSTYISLWSDQQYKDNSSDYVTFSKENILAADVNGNKYILDDSPYCGNGREFVIQKEISEPVNISVSKMEVDYKLKDVVKIDVKLPTNGETIEVNKDIYIEELDEKLILKAVKDTDDAIEFIFDTGTLEKKNSDIFMLQLSRRTHKIGVNEMFSGYCNGATEENKTITVGLDKADLLTTEKLTKKLSLKIKVIDIFEDGEWNFIIE